MSDANIVVIGAGIIGASVAYHLADMGVDGVIVIDKGDLDHNDGSTSHAPGGLRTLTGSHFFTKLGSASREVYDSLPLAEPGEEQFFRVGLMQVANTPERLASHRRLNEKGLSQGVDSHVLDPSGVTEYLPMVDPMHIAGGIFIPSSGTVRTSLIAASMRQVAEGTGNARFHGNSEALDLEIQGGRLRGVVTDNEELGTVKCEQAIICTNIWAPLLARKAGIPMPLFPGEHQYIFTDTVEAFADVAHIESTIPITTFDDLSVYFRQHFDHLGIGSYRHEARLVDPDQLPETAQLPFTPEDFTDAWRQMQHHMPTLQKSRIVDGFNGMFSFTVDHYPILGESPVAGLWSAVGAWLSYASEVGRVMARWMTDGDPGMDISPADINRFHTHQSSHQFLSKQAKYFYEIGFEDLHPSAVASSVRNVRHAPFHQRLESLGAEFIPVAGQETPLWYSSNEGLVDKYRDQIPDRGGYDAIGWTPVLGAEHLELRSNSGLVDWSAAIGPIEVSGPGALDHLQWLCSADVDIAVGRVVFSLVLNPSGGVVRDVTVARMGPEKWWILTGKANMPAELAYFTQSAPDDGSVAYRDLSEETAAIGIWGPNSREILQRCTSVDLTEGLPWYGWKEIDVGLAPVTAIRLSYVGELGYELYMPVSLSLHVWDELWETGRDFDMPAIGLGVLFSARLEKGYPLWGADLTPEFTPAESGVSWAMAEHKDFLGSKAAREAPIGKRVVDLRFDDPSSVVYGWEPVFIDGKVSGYVASGEYGYSVGAFLARAFIDAHKANPGTTLEVQASGVRHRAKILPGPLFDPENARLRA